MNIPILSYFNSLEMNVLGFDGVAALTDALKVNQSLIALK